MGLERRRQLTRPAESRQVWEPEAPLACEVPTSPRQWPPSVRRRTACSHPTHTVYWYYHTTTTTTVSGMLFPGQAGTRKAEPFWGDSGIRWTNTQYSTTSYNFFPSFLWSLDIKQCSIKRVQQLKTRKKSCFLDFEKTLKTYS